MGPPPDKDANGETLQDNHNRSPPHVAAHPPAHAQTTAQKSSWLNYFGFGSTGSETTDNAITSIAGTTDPATPYATPLSSSTVDLRRSPEVINLSPDPDDAEAERLEKERIAEEV